jgi:L-aminopeptidase/D-esterase-like protein
VGNAPGVLGERAGQGGAFGRLGSTRVAVFTVVNAVGALVDRGGQVVRGRFNPATGTRQPVTEMVGPGVFPLGNTTLTLVVTDLRLDRRSLEQIGRQVHSSMARAIQPFHTLNDGDVLYTVSTGAVTDEAVDPLALGVAASELAWDAVLASLTNVPPPLPASP